MTIGEKQTELLKILANPNHTGKSQTQLALTLGIDQSRVSRHIKQLEEKGLIEVDRSPNNNDVKELTRDGYVMATCSENRIPIIKDSVGALDLRLHRFVVKFKISNWRSVTDDAWIERYLSAKPSRTVYDPTSETYKVFTESFEARITERHVFVHVKDINGVNANNLKNRALVRALDARDWIESNAPPVEIANKPVDSEVWTNEQHLAIVRDPFAELVANESGVKMSEVRVCDSDGEVRLIMDRSTGKPELESENFRYGEDDIGLLKDHYRWMLENPEEVQEIRGLADRVEELEGRVESKDEDDETVKPTPESRELSFTSKWVDNHGNLMGYSEELAKPVKILDKDAVNNL